MLLSYFIGQKQPLLFPLKTLLKSPLKTLLTCQESFPLWLLRAFCKLKKFFYLLLTIGSFPGFERFLKHIFWSILEKNHLQIFSFSLESLFSLVSCCINPIHLYSWHSECYFLFSAKRCGSLGSLPLLYSPSP